MQIFPALVAAACLSLASSSTIDPSSGSVTISTGTYALLARSSTDQLFTLSKIASDGTETHAGRSYDGHAWEGTMPGALVFDCSVFDDACSVWLSATNDDDDGDDDGAFYYRCDAKSVTALTDEQQLSRFLTQASFGPTRTSLTDIEALAANASVHAAAGWWVAAQMTEPATLHREYYRKRANPRTPQAVVVGAVRGACEEGSRWHRHAFTRADTGKTIEVAYIDGVYTLTVDGVARTETTAFNASSYLAPYIICDDVDESVGGDITYGTNCKGLLANPVVAFSTFDTTIANATFSALQGRKYNDENPLARDVALLVDPPVGCDSDSCVSRMFSLVHPREHAFPLGFRRLDTTFARVCRTQSIVTLAAPRSVCVAMWVPCVTHAPLVRLVWTAGLPQVRGERDLVHARERHGHAVHIRPATCDA